MQEVWYDIKGAEGCYQMNNIFEFRSLDRVIIRSDGKKKNFKSKKIKIYSSKHLPYPHISITKNGKRTKMCVHRIIAELFIPNPENKKYVNHKNGIKTDYSVGNLEWVTKSEDLVHAYSNGLKQGVKGSRSHFYRQKYTAGRIGGKHPFSKMVLDTSNGIFYNSIKEAARSKNLIYGTLVARLNGSCHNNTSFVYA